MITALGDAGYTHPSGSVAGSGTHHFRPAISNGFRVTIFSNEVGGGTKPTGGYAVERYYTLHTQPAKFFQTRKSAIFRVIRFLARKRQEKGGLGG